jgi:uncharacterized protein (DUF2147 family)
MTVTHPACRKRSIALAARFGAFVALAGLLAPSPPSAFAGPLTSPVGLWKTFNDDLQPTALIRVSETAGVVSGKVEKILLGDPALKCTACPAGDPRKDLPVLGMIVLQGLKKDGDIYGGGTILKVADGRIAKAELRLIDGGQRLELTGRVGPFSKKAVWAREE